MSVTPKELRELADDYEPRSLYQSEWRDPIRMLRRAADALELAEVDRNCLRAAIRASAEHRSATEASSEDDAR